jgi:hypothetical protein
VTGVEDAGATTAVLPVGALLVDDSAEGVTLVLSAPDALAVALSAESVLGAIAGALPLALKSVTYQPEPFNWKPAAVSCFLKVGWLQDGQISNNGSDVFCNTSLANPQDSHL